MALAGAWLGTHVTATPARLLEELKTETGKVSQEVLAEMTPQGALGETYARSVVATLTLHLGELKHPWSRSVLEIAAFLHPADIPAQVFLLFCWNWPLRCESEELAADDFASQLDLIHEAIEELHGRSLVRIDDGAITMHRLTQRALRAGMFPADRQAALSYVLEALGHLLADALDPLKLAEHAPFTAHAAHALELARDADVDAEAGIVAVHVANYLHNRAEYPSALEAAELADRCFRAAFGDEHEMVATALIIRGYILHACGDLDRALGSFSEAETVYREIFGADYPELAGLLNDRGSVFQDKGDLEDAVRCYTEAERIDREVFGHQHPDVARDINNRGDALREMGNLNGALRCFEEAEQIISRVFTAEHPSAVSCINNRGLALLAKGDLDDSLRCFEKAELLDRNIVGDDHPKIATAINNRGNVLWRKGDLEGALRCFTEAERIDRKALGNEHPKVASDINNRGSILGSKGDLEGALKCYREVFPIFLRKLGPRASSTLTGADNLLALGADPFALARELAGAEVAADLERYFWERQERRG